MGSLRDKTLNTYKKYKTARNASWQVLLDYDIKELPINLVELIQKLNIDLVKNSDAQILLTNESGKSIFAKNKWFIIYDDKVNLGRKNFTIAHELGHIFLEHSEEDKQIKSPETRSIAERQADSFAVRLLAPACVLWGLNVTTVEQIQKFCQISFTASTIRKNRLDILYKRNKFLTNPLERLVFKNFSEFIEKNKLQDEPTL